MGPGPTHMAASTPMMEKASAGVRDILSALSTSEARYFDEERYSEAEIRKALSDSLTDRKIDAMKRILAAVSVGRDASPLFPDVVKNVSFQSLELKKLIYIYLVQYAENNRDLALLSINSFQKDLENRSPLVRASGLRAMASIKVLEVIQLVMHSVRNASNDSSPYVRKTAAQCMTKVYAVDPDQFFELRGLLVKLMSDLEVPVVGSAMMAFHHLCITRPPPSAVAAAAAAAAGASGTDEALRVHLALLHPHFRRLCQDVLLMDSWAQQSCIDVLLRYCRLFFACPDRKSAPEDDAEVPEDLATFLKSLRLLLSSSSKGVTLAAAVALCYLAPSQDLKVITMPLLKCLRQAAPESAHALFVAFIPIVEARPELVRPSIREFFVQSFDFPAVKKLKVKILELLADETNVQLVLRELQAYVTWQSHPDFVALAVRGIAQVALKIPSVADSCLRGLVKMLDSKCEVLSCEAVVALRALLQQRHQSAESGLGSVLPHLVRCLEDLAAPTARASVVWIIGQYQREVPRLAPDVVRRLAKSFITERQEVKQQALGLALKVWAFHTLNARGDVPTAGSSGEVPEPGVGAPAAAKQPLVTPEESGALLPRLEAVVEHITDLASYDAAWDVREMARAFKKLREAAKAGLAGDLGSAGAPPAGLEGLGAWYAKTCVGIGQTLAEGMPGRAWVSATPSQKEQGFQATWILGSLAQALDFPLDTYRPLPAWAQENSEDQLRKPKVEQVAVPAAKSISSSTVDNMQHMETRVQIPSNISNLPVVSSLEDLDLFYSEEIPKGPSQQRSLGAAAGGLPFAAAEPPQTLEQMRLGGGSIPGVVGTAVFGEDDESESEEEERDEDDSDWKYCLQASQCASAPQAAVTPAPAQVAVTAAVQRAVEEEAPAAPPGGDAAAAVVEQAPPEVTEEAPAIAAPLAEAPAAAASAVAAAAAATAAEAAPAQEALAAAEMPVVEEPAVAAQDLDTFFAEVPLLGVEEQPGPLATGGAAGLLDFSPPPREAMAPAEAPMGAEAAAAPAAPAPPQAEAPAADAPPGEALAPEVLPAEAPAAERPAAEALAAAAAPAPQAPPDDSLI